MLKPMPKMCPTCPFRRNGYTSVRSLLESRALMKGTPICHSTGDSDLTEKKIYKEDRACRGARNLQLKYFTSIGFIHEATDEAWEAKVKELGL